MREFKDPYYAGPECVCCSKQTKEITIDGIAAEILRGVLKEQEEKILLVVRQERRKWAAGSTVAKVLDKIIDTVIYKGRID